MRTSSLTGDPPVSQGEGEGGQLVCCLHSNLLLHVYVPAYFSLRGGSWDFGC